MAEEGVPKPGDPGFIGPVPTTPTMLVPNAEPTERGPAAADRTGDTVTVDIEALRDFCGGSLQRMRDDLAQAKQDLDGVPASAWLFSEAAAGRTLAQQHSAVREVYSSTLAGLLADVERLQANLRKQMDGYQRADDDAAEALLRLGRAMTSAPLAADTMRAQAIQARSGPGPVTPAEPMAPAAPASPAAAQPPDAAPATEGF